MDKCSPFTVLKKPNPSLTSYIAVNIWQKKGVERWLLLPVGLPAVGWEMSGDFCGAVRRVEFREGRNFSTV